MHSPPSPTPSPTLTEETSAFGKKESKYWKHSVLTQTGPVDILEGTVRWGVKKFIQKILFIHTALKLDMTSRIRIHMVFVRLRLSHAGKSC